MEPGSLTAIALAHSIFGSDQFDRWMEEHSDEYEGSTGLYHLIQTLADELDDLVAESDPNGWAHYDWYLTCDRVADRLFDWPTIVYSLEQISGDGDILVI